MVVVAVTLIIFILVNFALMKNIKNTLFIILILFSISNKIIAVQVNLDSLILLSENTIEKSEKLKLLNQIANQMRYTKNEDAAKYLIRSEELALELRDWDQLAESYILQGIVWHNSKEVDSAFYYLNKGLNLSKEHDYFNGIIKGSINLGLFNYIKKDYKTALEHYKEGITVVERVSDIETVIMLFNNIALLYKSIGEYDLTFEYYHKALLLCEETNNSKGAGIVSSNLGLLYEKQKMYTKALEYLFKSLEIRRSRKNLKGESIVLNNLGVVYEGMGEYNMALEYYDLSLKIKEQLNQKKGIAKIYNNIGVIYKKEGKLDSARINYNRSLEINRKLNNRTGVSHNYTNIGILFKLEKEFEKAILFFNKAAEIAEEDNDIQELVRIYKGLSYCFKAVENYKNAYEYFYKYQIVNDSIYNLNSKKYIEEVEGKYQNLKIEKENQVLLKDNLLKDEKLKIHLVISLMIVFVTISILLVLLVVVRNKVRLERINNVLANKNTEIEKQKRKLKLANNELIELNSFKEDMINMLVHDLKNPLNVILNSDQFNDNATKEEIIERASIQMLNLINNLLDVTKYEHSKMKLNLSEVNIINVIDSAVKHISILLNNRSLKILGNDINEIKIIADVEIMQRIIINLISNAIKFSKFNGEIIIQLTRFENKIQIAIQDFGFGIPEDKLELIFDKYEHTKSKDAEKFSSTGLGLTFCKMAAEAHGTILEVKSKINEGSVFSFILNIKE